MHEFQQCLYLTLHRHHVLLAIFHHVRSDRNQVVLEIDVCPLHAMHLVSAQGGVVY